jgi:hypothetical protein
VFVVSHIGWGCDHGKDCTMWGGGLGKREKEKCICCYAENNTCACVIIMLRKTRDKETQAGGPTNNSFLHEAVRANRRSVVAELLSKETSNALVNSSDNFGNTPLHIAGSGGSKEMVELLILHGANASLADKSSWTPLHRFRPPQSSC